MRKNNDILAKLTIWLIKNFWKKYFGIYYNKKHHIICRFYPTCSDYSIIALNKYGFLKGVKMTTQRIKRCTITNTESCYDYPE